MSELAAPLVANDLSHLEGLASVDDVVAAALEFWRPPDEAPNPRPTPLPALPGAAVLELNNLRLTLKLPASVVDPIVARALASLTSRERADEAGRFLARAAVMCAAGGAYATARALLARLGVLSAKPPAFWDAGTSDGCLAAALAIYGRVPSERTIRRAIVETLAALGRR